MLDCIMGLGNNYVPNFPQMGLLTNYKYNQG